MKEVGLITIHGMGKIKLDYYAELEMKLKKELGKDWDRISFQNVQYAPLFQKAQEKLWQDMVNNSSNNLDFIKIRQFFLFGFGDAGSLEFSAHYNKIKYISVQKEIQKRIDKVFKELGDDISKPIVIIAHSLGCQVISNYLWDAGKNLNIFSNSNKAEQNAKVTRDNKKFRKLKSLENLITTGCNIPLFISGINDRKCFPKPNDNFIWDNYYDPDDVLGWPLRQLGDSYNSIVKDHHINAGGLFTSWNPASHCEYWSDSDVINPLVKILKSKLNRFTNH